MAAPETGREADPVYMGRHGPGRGAYNAAYQQRRSVADFHRTFHARKQALHQRRNATEGLSGAGFVSALVGMAGREWHWASLPDLLQQQLPAAPSRRSSEAAGSGSD